MIEKLNLEEVDNPGEATLKAFSILNQLVDAVNELQLAKDVMFNRIDMLNNAICDIRNRITTLDDPTYHEAEAAPADPYAEQRKWIGKLCWFWDFQEEKFVSILGEITDNGTYFPKDSIVSYLNCEPVKPDDDIIYTGE
jgi:hypothetical protein